MLLDVAPLTCGVKSVLPSGNIIGDFVRFSDCYFAVDVLLYASIKPGDSSHAATLSQLDMWLLSPGFAAVQLQQNRSSGLHHKSDFS